MHRGYFCGNFRGQLRDTLVMLRREAVLLVDWLNLSISVNKQRLASGPELAASLMKVAESLAKEHGDVPLTRAHFVSETDFLTETLEAIGQSSIARAQRVRTVKEQADLTLAVLAMDQLHNGAGCPELFLLTSGDQDFLPVVQRIVAAGAFVVLIVGALDRLAAEYRYAVAQLPRTRLLPITDAADLKEIPDVTGDRTSACILGLLRLYVSGGHLGGNQRRNARLMSSWGVLTPGADPELELADLLDQFAKLEERVVAWPAKNSTGNRSTPARRRFLNFELPEVTRTVQDADWILRRIGNKKRPADSGTLGMGRFRDDDGTRLARVVTALTMAGWLSEAPNGTLEPSLEWHADGLLEPLWRVVCEVSRRTHEAPTRVVSRDQLFRDLCRGQIAHDPRRRGGRHAGAAISLARRLGVLEAVPVDADGFALAVARSHPVARQAETLLLSLARALDGRVGTFVPQYEMVGLMGDWDSGSARPIFGYDVRDRHQVLRVLRRADLIASAGDANVMLKLKHSAWLRRLLNGE
jgi:NYN domain